MSKSPLWSTKTPVAATSAPRGALATAVHNCTRYVFVVLSILENVISADRRPPANPNSTTKSQSFPVGVGLESGHVELVAGNGDGLGLATALGGVDVGELAAPVGDAVGVSGPDPNGDADADGLGRAADDGPQSPSGYGAR